MSAPFLPIRVRDRAAVPPPPGVTVGPVRNHWTSFLRVVPSRHDGPVSRVEFSPAAPHEAAVTAGAAVTLLDAATSGVRRRLSRFKDIARGGSYKGDGRLLVAGGDNGVVQVFDLASRAILRTFKGHKGAVHTTRFSSDGLRILSGGDDATVKVWDVPTSRLLTTLSGATDYVRCQSPSPSSPHLWAVGSYDHHTRLYDLRTRGAIFDLDHGAQVEDVVLLPGGGLALSVGGPQARVWDLLGGGSVVNTLGSHAKAVTCAVVRPDGRLFTGGLDCSVKVHDVATWTVLHTYFYASQVLSVGASADGGRVAAGLVDGTCVVRHRDAGAAKALAKAARAGGVKAPADDSGPPPGAPTAAADAMESDTDGSSSDEEGEGLTDAAGGLPDFIAPRKSPFKQTPFAGWGRAPAPNRRSASAAARKAKRWGAAARPDPGAIIGGGPAEPRPRLGPCEFALRRYEWRAALDLALGEGAPTAVGVLEELIVRGRLDKALELRTEAELRPLVGLLAANVAVPEYTGLMVEVAEVVLDQYGERIGSGALTTLRSAVQAEVQVLGELEQCLGMCQLVLGRP